MSDRIGRHRLVQCACLIVVLSIFSGPKLFATAVGDQVELTATHPDGVPFHRAPQGAEAFQRVPDGTTATVIELAKGGQWLKLSLPDGRTGWVTSRYVRRAGAPSPTPTPKPPQRIEEGPVQRVADGDTLTVITSNQTKLRIRMVGIDAPETPKGTKYPGQHYGQEAEAHLKQLVEDKRVTVEIYAVDRYKRLLSLIFLDGKDINLAMIDAGLAEVYRGPASDHPYKEPYQVAEVAARSAKQGMCTLGDRYERPRDYRRRVGISP